MPYDAKEGFSPTNRERALRAGRAASVCATFVATWSAHALGAAQDIRLTGQGCEDYDPARVSELLEIEVETIVSERSFRPSDVALACTDRGVSIRVALRDGTAALSGQVDPRGTERAARSRLLALTISELLAQLWAMEAKAKPIPREAAPADSGPTNEPAVERETAVYAGFAFRSLGEPRAALFGATLVAEYQPLRALAIAIDLEALQGSVQSEHAKVGMRAYSAALHAAIGQRFGDWALGLGPGARIGWANLSPSELAPSTVGSSVSGPWAGPLLLARVRWSKDWLSLYSAFETGVVTLPLTGTLDGESPELEIRGAWLAGCVGLGARF